MRLVTQVVFAVISAKTTKVYSISVYWYRLLFVTSVRWPSPEWSLRLTRRPSVSVCWREIRTWAPHLQSRSVLKHKIMIYLSFAVCCLRSLTETLFIGLFLHLVLHLVPGHKDQQCHWQPDCCTRQLWSGESFLLWLQHIIVVQNGVCKVTMQGAVMLWHWSTSGGSVRATVEVRCRLRVVLISLICCFLAWARSHSCLLSCRPYQLSYLCSEELSLRSDDRRLLLANKPPY